MRKLRFVKIVKPELFAYYGSGPGIDNMEPDYRCIDCGFGVAEDYKCCPHCGAELNWGKVREPSKEFKKLISRL